MLRVSANRGGNHQETGGNGYAPRKLLSRRQAWETLGVRQDTLDRMLHSGKIPMVRVGRRVFVEEADLWRYVDAHKDNAFGSPADALELVTGPRTRARATGATA